LKVATQEKIEELYRELCKGNKLEKMEAIKLFFSLLPKESKVEIDATVGPKVVIIREAEEKPIDVEGGKK
jgi:hypothetical protein